MTPIDRCYADLELRPGASWEQIKRAYREQVRRHHPDRCQGAAREQRAAEDRMKRVTLAYAQIRDAMVSPPAVLHPPTAAAVAVPDGVSRESAYAVYSGHELGAVSTDEAPYARAVRLYYDGLEHYREGRTAEAVSALRVSVCLHPDNSDAHMKLGLCFRVQGRPGKAAAAFEQAIRLGGAPDDAYLLLALTWLECGDFARAAEVCTQGLIEDPLNPDLQQILNDARERLTPSETLSRRRAG